MVYSETNLDLLYFHTLLFCDVQVDFITFYFIVSVCDVHTDSNEEIARYVNGVNAAIAPFNLEIKKGVQEEDGASFYCLVSILHDVIIRNFYYKVSA